MSSSPLRTYGLPDAVCDTIEAYLSSHFGEAWQESDVRVCLCTEHHPATPEDCDRIIRVGASADSHLSAPFSLDELASHIAPMLAGDTPPVWPLWNTWIFDATSRTLCCQSLKQTIELTDKEALLLVKLMQCAPQSMDKTALLEAVWGYNSNIDTKTLETHIYRLRQKLEPLLPDADKGIQTEAYGYRWQP